MKCEFLYDTVLDSPKQAGLPAQPDGKWYFWTETWADALGPYDTEHQASLGAIHYAKHFLGVCPTSDGPEVKIILREREIAEDAH